MPAVSRREFLSLPAPLPCWRCRLPDSRPRRLAAMGPNDKFDLVIKGGEVLDPSQNLRAKRDIGIRFGVIEALEADIPADKALQGARRRGQARHARASSTCTPMSSRTARPSAFPPTSWCPSRPRRRWSRPATRAPTTFAAFRRAIVGQTRTRLYAFVHIANIGLAGVPGAELYNIDFAQTDAAAKAVAENADLVLGVKVRMSENVIAKHGLEPLKRAIQACEMAGTRRQGHVPHRRGRDARADEPDPGYCCAPATS